MRKSYFSPDFYAMKDIIHHAHTRKDEFGRNIKMLNTEKSHDDEKYSNELKESFDSNLLLNKDLSKTLMNKTGTVPWKYRRNPIFGL